MDCAYCGIQYSTQTYGAFCSAKCQSKQLEELDLDFGYLLVDEYDDRDYENLSVLHGQSFNDDPLNDLS